MDHPFGETFSFRITGDASTQPYAFPRHIDGTHNFTVQIPPTPGIDGLRYDFVPEKDFTLDFSAGTEMVLYRRALPANINEWKQFRTLSLSSHAVPLPSMPYETQAAQQTKHAKLRALHRSIREASSAPSRKQCERQEECLVKDILKGLWGDLAMEAFTFAPPNEYFCLPNFPAAGVPSSGPEDWLMIQRTIAVGDSLILTVEPTEDWQNAAVSLRIFDEEGLFLEEIQPFRRQDGVCFFLVRPLTKRRMFVTVDINPLYVHLPSVAFLLTDGWQYPTDALMEGISGGGVRTYGDYRVSPGQTFTFYLARQTNIALPPPRINFPAYWWEEALEVDPGIPFDGTPCDISQIRIFEGVSIRRTSTWELCRFDLVIPSREDLERAHSNVFGQAYLNRYIDFHLELSLVNSRTYPIDVAPFAFGKPEPWPNNLIEGGFIPAPHGNFKELHGPGSYYGYAGTIYVAGLAVNTLEASSSPSPTMPRVALNGWRIPAHSYGQSSGMFYHYIDNIRGPSLITVSHPEDRTVSLPKLGYTDYMSLFTYDTIRGHAPGFYHMSVDSLAGFRFRLIADRRYLHGGYEVLPVVQALGHERFGPDPAGATLTPIAITSGDNGIDTIDYAIDDEVAGWMNDVRITITEPKTIIAVNFPDIPPGMSWYGGNHWSGERRPGYHYYTQPSPYYGESFFMDSFQLRMPWFYQSPPGMSLTLVDSLNVEPVGVPGRHCEVSLAPMSTTDSLERIYTWRLRVGGVANRAKLTIFYDTLGDVRRLRMPFRDELPEGLQYALSYFEGGHCFFGKDEALYIPVYLDNTWRGHEAYIFPDAVESPTLPIPGGPPINFAPLTTDSIHIPLVKLTDPPAHLYALQLPWDKMQNGTVLFRQNDASMSSIYLDAPVLDPTDPMNPNWPVRIGAASDLVPGNNLFSRLFSVTTWLELAVQDFGVPNPPSVWTQIADNGGEGYSRILLQPAEQRGDTLYRYRIDKPETVTNFTVYVDYTEPKRWQVTLSTTDMPAGILYGSETPTGVYPLTQDGRSFTFAVDVPTKGTGAAGVPNSLLTPLPVAVCDVGRRPAYAYQPQWIDSPETGARHQLVQRGDGTYMRHYYRIAVVDTNIRITVPDAAAGLLQLSPLPEGFSYDPLLMSAGAHPFKLTEVQQLRLAIHRDPSHAGVSLNTRWNVLPETLDFDRYWLEKKGEWNGNRMEITMEGGFWGRDGGAVPSLRDNVMRELTLTTLSADYTVELPSLPAGLCYLDGRDEGIWGYDKDDVFYLRLTRLTPYEAMSVKLFQDDIPLQPLSDTDTLVWSFRNVNVTGLHFETDFRRVDFDVQTAASLSPVACDLPEGYVFLAEKSRILSPDVQGIRFGVTARIGAEAVFPTVICQRAGESHTYPLEAIAPQSGASPGTVTRYYQVDLSASHPSAEIRLETDENTFTAVLDSLYSSEMKYVEDPLDPDDGPNGRQPGLYVLEADKPFSFCIQLTIPAGEPLWVSGGEPFTVVPMEGNLWRYVVEHVNAHLHPKFFLDVKRIYLPDTAATASHRLPPEVEYAPLPAGFPVLFRNPNQLWKDTITLHVIDPVYHRIQPSVWLNGLAASPPYESPSERTHRYALNDVGSPEVKVTVSFDYISVLLPTPDAFFEYAGVSPVSTEYYALGDKARFEVRLLGGRAEGNAHVTLPNGTIVKGTRTPDGHLAFVLPVTKDMDGKRLTLNMSWSTFTLPPLPEGMHYAAADASRPTRYHGDGGLWRDTFRIETGSTSVPLAGRPTPEIWMADTIAVPLRSELLSDGGARHTYAVSYIGTPPSTWIEVRWTDIRNVDLSAILTVPNADSELVGDKPVSGQYRKGAVIAFSIRMTGALAGSEPGLIFADGTPITGKSQGNGIYRFELTVTDDITLQGITPLYASLTLPNRLPEGLSYAPEDAGRKLRLHPPIVTWTETFTVLVSDFYRRVTPTFTLREGDEATIVCESAAADGSAYRYRITGTGNATVQATLEAVSAGFAPEEDWYRYVYPQQPGLSYYDAKKPTAFTLQLCGDKEAAIPLLILTSKNGVVATISGTQRDTTPAVFYDFAVQLEQGATVSFIARYAVFRLPSASELPKGVSYGVHDAATPVRYFTPDGIWRDSVTLRIDETVDTRTLQVTSTGNSILMLRQPAGGEDGRTFAYDITAQGDASIAVTLTLSALQLPQLLPAELSYAPGTQTYRTYALDKDWRDSFDLVVNDARFHTVAPTVRSTAGDLLPMRALPEKGHYRCVVTGKAMETATVLIDFAYSRIFLTAEDYNLFHYADGSLAAGEHFVQRDGHFAVSAQPQGINANSALMIRLNGMEPCYGTKRAGTANPPVSDFDVIARKDYEVTFEPYFYTLVLPRT
jgi:hypothetical protein